MAASVTSMSADELAVRLQQQELVARFGLLALERPGLTDVLQEACIVAAEGLQTKLAKVLRYRPATGDFLVVAGVGWHAGVVGASTLAGGLDSPAGYALLTGEPVRSNYLPEEERFRVPAMLAEHGVQSALNVVVGPPGDETFGVLEADSTNRERFDAADTAFLQSLANVLAAALARAEAESAKDELLREKDLLMQEVHHRVKNSLQLVHTLLQLQARTASEETRQQLEGAAGRIITIGAVHHRLYAGASVDRADAKDFLGALLDDMRPMLADVAPDRPVRLDAPALLLPADALTPLGLVVSELVTNAVKYGAGQIRVELSDRPDGLQVTVEDEGTGFPSEFSPASSTGLGMRLIQALAKGGAAALRVDRSVAHGRITVVLKQ